MIRDAVTARWGAPEADPLCIGGAFAIPALRLGHVAIGIQPARGYNLDPKGTYHDPDLVPPHGYFAFYIWLREVAGVHAVIHLGKHGNLEWLPGKALALSEACYPEAALGAVPNIYPFIVNDPGEGSQAKRRTSAVIIDHLTPPMTRAETYGPLKELEALADEYYEAAGVDEARRRHLAGEILATTARLGLDKDIGIACGCTAGRGAGGARQSSVRIEGDADPRRAAYFRPLAVRAAAHGFAGGARAGAARGRRGRRCLADRGAGRRFRAGWLRAAKLCARRAVGRSPPASPRRNRQRALANQWRHGRASGIAGARPRCQYAPAAHGIARDRLARSPSPWPASRGPFSEPRTTEWAARGFGLGSGPERRRAVCLAPCA